MRLRKQWGVQTKIPGTYRWSNPSNWYNTPTIPQLSIQTAKLTTPNVEKRLVSRVISSVKVES